VTVREGNFEDTFFANACRWPCQCDLRHRHRLEGEHQTGVRSIKMKSKTHRRKPLGEPAGPGGPVWPAHSSMGRYGGNEIAEPEPDGAPSEVPSCYRRSYETANDAYSCWTRTPGGDHDRQPVPHGSAGYSQTPVARQEVGNGFLRTSPQARTFS